MLTNDILLFLSFVDDILQLVIFRLVVLKNGIPITNCIMIKNKMQNIKVHKLAQYLLNNILPLE